MRVLFGLVMTLATASAEVSLMRVPEGGIQPQAAVDGSGRIHLVYFKGPARAGDLFYVHKSTGASEFSRPMRVNSKTGSAIAVGTIRGAQIAVGKNARVHVAWNSADGKEMVYTRLNDAADAFEPERSVMTWTGGLDGGGSVAADERGNVYVSWHGSAPDNKQGEAGRAVFVATSRDEGKSFAKEVQANPLPTGVCGCCGMKALAAGEELYLLYRAATKITGRDMTLLVSDGKDFTQRVVSKWTIGSCPMSSAALVKAPTGVLAAWELEGQVTFSPARELEAVSPEGKGRRKHPSLAVNKAGTILLAWAENTGWERGGSLAWQLFKDQKPITAIERAEGIAVWSMPAALAIGERFYIIY